MKGERTHRPPKPILITWPGLRNQYYPDHYSSILGASIHTGINRNTLTHAAETGQPIKKGKGKGCTVKYRDPEDENKRLKQYEEFKAKKELAAFGLASAAEALSELERLKVFEPLYYRAVQRIKGLESQLRGYKCDQ